MAKKIEKQDREEPRDVQREKKILIERIRRRRITLPKGAPSPEQLIREDRER